MTTAARDLPALDVRALSRPSPLRGAITFVRRKPLGAIGALLVLVLVVLAVFAPALAPFGPLTFDSSAVRESPNSVHYFGTDEKGRDVFSRVLYGAQISLQVGVIAAVIGITFGLTVGITSGYLGGKVDFFSQRVVDSFQAFPALFLALAVTTALRRQEWSFPFVSADVTKVGLALALATWPAASRVIRSAVLAQKNTMYVEAARAVGAQTPRILARHILPNVASIYIILTTAALGQAILVEASLSFLGAGIPAPAPSWGGMILDAQRIVKIAPWVAIFPGLAITAAVFGFNLFGDALRDYLDPRLRGSR